uniref:Cationic amino acid transporter C-terminal domain-containing protein n=2 Tax=Odontella aurita TaxID=265563 RepID=A0A7S4IL23_9STRA|mmetsp:Transcript_26716/g.78930  ORF Transcript_26716/g.78930 Transcript_26716/m.78930 type:complete len:615 (+) Transcript_26716:175-2019(+)
MEVSQRGSVEYTTAPSVSPSCRGNESGGGGGDADHASSSSYNRQSSRVTVAPVPPPLSPSPWIRKPLFAASDPHVVACPESSGALHRHLTLFDLICVGVGATVGSGIFVLCGLIAHNSAGPATFLSWGVAGVAACMSGLCYAELAGRFPSAGSSYAYAYISMGELPAVLAGACMTLEYVFSASAVARSWGDKVVEFARVHRGDEDDGLMKFLDPGNSINPMAFVISTCAILLHLKGVKESKAVTNFFSLLKLCLVLFMTIGSFVLMNPENLSPLVPPEFGARGIFTGASTLFFGYIGYDEICCMAGEAINPSRNLPRAVLASLATVTVLYILAAVALTGMVPYQDISETSPFPDGFRYRGIIWASQLSAIGELFTLPLVVLVSIMAQPRLQYAMATDGLIPPIFAKMDANGNLWWGTLISGIVMILIATFVPFTFLNDLISAGILIAFTITDSSVILLRHASPEDKPLLLEKLLVVFNILAIISGLLLSNYMDSDAGQVFAAFGVVALIILMVEIKRQCPPLDLSNVMGSSAGFKTPFMPFLPLLGSVVNWYLIAHLDSYDIVLLIVYCAVVMVGYYLYGIKRSVGNHKGWSTSPDDDYVESVDFELTSQHKIT